jgi:hypothetical protein
VVGALEAVVGATEAVVVMGTAVAEKVGALVIGLVQSAAQTFLGQSQAASNAVNRNLVAVAVVDTAEARATEEAVEVVEIATAAAEVVTVVAIATVVVVIAMTTGVEMQAIPSSLTCRIDREEVSV